VTELLTLSGYDGGFLPRYAGGGGERKRAGGGGGSTFDGEQNLFQFLVSQHVPGTNAEDPYPLLRKPHPTALVMGRLARGVVRQPIHLNGQPCGRTIEIKNAGSERVLPAKRTPGSRFFRRACHSTISGKLISRRNSRARLIVLCGARIPPPPCFAWFPSPATRGRSRSPLSLLRFLPAVAAAQRIVGMTYSAPVRMPAGQRAVTVFSRV
jgi:hypothetical protein